MHTMHVHSCVQAADVFGLGCTFFYMLTGRDAFDFEAEEESHDDLLDQIEEGQVRRLGQA